VNHVGGRLYLLATGDPGLALLAARRPDVVVEGEDLRCASRLLDELRAGAVVTLDHVLVPQEVEIRAAVGPGEQLEPIARERGSCVARELSWTGTSRFSIANPTTSESLPSRSRRIRTAPLRWSELRTECAR
jgi:hypothetical protein